MTGAWARLGLACEADDGLGASWTVCLQGPGGQLAGLHPTLAHHLVSTLGWNELRPLQQAAIAPVVTGQDALLLAPTAGGKTEAAAFPVLSRMAAEARVS